MLFASDIAKGLALPKDKETALNPLLKRTFQASDEEGHQYPTKCEFETGRGVNGNGNALTCIDLTRWGVHDRIFLVGFCAMQGQKRLSGFDQVVDKHGLEPGDIVKLWESAGALRFSVYKSPPVDWVGVALCVSGSLAPRA